MDYLATIAFLTCATLSFWACDAAQEIDSDLDDKRATPVELSSPAEDLDQERSSLPAVVAVVNDRKIIASDVERRLDRLAELYHHSRRPFDENIRRVKRRELVNRLIDRELIRAYIAAGNFDIDPGAVDEELQRRIEQRFGSSDIFRRYLNAEDLSIADYRRQIREELVLRRVILHSDEAEPVDQADLREQYERIARHRPVSERLNALAFSIRIPAGTDAADRKKIQQSLQNTFSATRSAQDFARHAENAGHDRDTTRLEQVKWVEHHQLHPAASRVLFGPQAPQVGLSPIIETPLGFELYWIRERRPAGVRAFDEVEDLLRTRANQARFEERRRQLLHRLHDEASITIYLDEKNEAHRR